MAGVLSGLFGIGGGLVVVPALFYVLQIQGASASTAIIIATSTSLALIIPTSIASGKAHYKKGNVRLDIIRLWWLGVVISAVFGGVFITIFPGALLVQLFGFIAALASLNMFIHSFENQTNIRHASPRMHYGMSIAVGCVSAMVGIGGGTMSAPLLRWFGVPIKESIGTASVLGFFIALPSVLTLMIISSEPQDAPFGTWLLFNIPSLVIVMPCTYLCAPIGVYLGSMMNSEHLTRCFSFVLFLLGVRMLFF